MSRGGDSPTNTLPNRAGKLRQPVLQDEAMPIYNRRQIVNLPYKNGVRCETPARLAGGPAVPPSNSRIILQDKAASTAGR